MNFFFATSSENIFALPLALPMSPYRAAAVAWFG